jgi:hypothetical protein
MSVFSTYKSRGFRLPKRRPYHPAIPWNFVKHLLYGSRMHADGSHGVQFTNRSAVCRPNLSKTLHNDHEIDTLKLVVGSRSQVGVAENKGFLVVGHL